VVYAYNPSNFWEAEIVGLLFKASPGKKLLRTDLKKQARHGDAQL
jgi:hypothetical protein